ncbi:hypothetical protein [Mycobacterium sp.]|uniref:hypothetical protein n=1 Tax=Mycobacterium sp. TaxID=1785 RepID=UPI003F94DB63
MNTTNTSPATVVNLREAKREQAAAKKAASPKPAPAKAPAEPAPKKQAGDKTAVAKITWKNLGEKNEKGECEGVGTADGREYRIMRDGDAFKATVKLGGKTTAQAEGVSGKTAWQKCVAHNKGVAA